MRRASAAFLIFLAAVPGFAGDEPDLSKYGAAYLNLRPSARAAAMGNAHGAVVPREATDAFNPATLALVDAQYFSATSASIGLGRRLVNFGYVFPCHWNSKENFFLAEPYVMSTPRDTWRGFVERAEATRYAIYVGGTSFGIEDLPGSGEYGAPGGEFNDTERNFGLALAFRPVQNVAFGISGRMLRQSLHDGNADGMAFGAGFWYGVPRFFVGDLDLGLGIRDAAGKLKWQVNDPELGVSYGYDEDVASKIYLASAWTSPRRRWLATLDVVDADDVGMTVNAGVELSLTGSVRLRAGAKDFQPTMGWGLSLGRRMFDVALDYAFQPDTESLSNMQWFTLTLRFMPITAGLPDDDGASLHRLDQRAPAASEPAPRPADRRTLDAPAPKDTSVVPATSAPVPASPTPAVRKAPAPKASPAPRKRTLGGSSKVKTNRR